MTTLNATPQTSLPHVPHAATQPIPRWWIVPLWVLGMFPAQFLIEQQTGDTDSLLAQVIRVFWRLYDAFFTVGLPYDRPPHLLPYYLIEVSVLSMLMAMAYGLLQSIWLHWYVAKPWRWFSYLLSSLILAGCLRVWLAEYTENPFDFTWFGGEPLTAPLVGLVLGMLQARFFRLYTKRAWAWGLASALGFWLSDTTLQSLQSEVLYPSSLARGQLADQLWPFISYIRWGIYTIVMAPVLWWILRGMRFGLDGKALLLTAIPAPGEQPVQAVVLNPAPDHPKP